MSFCRLLNNIISPATGMDSQATESKSFHWILYIFSGSKTVANVEEFSYFIGFTYPILSLYFLDFFNPSSLHSSNKTVSSSLLQSENKDTAKA